MLILALLAILYFLYRSHQANNETPEREVAVESSIIVTQPKPYKYVGADTYVDDRGYRRFSDSNILVHRYIAGKKLGRKLCSEEVVHHVDGNKLNNAPSNLEVIQSWEEHDALHRNYQLVYGSWHKPINSPLS